MASFCRTRGEILDVDTNMVNQGISTGSGKQYYKNICRPCHNKEVSLVEKLHRVHKQPSPGSRCECCGRIDRLFLNHCHTTGAYRGWLCGQCNLSLGLLGDLQKVCDKHWLIWKTRIKEMDYSAQIAALRTTCQALLQSPPAQEISDLRKMVAELKRDLRKQKAVTNKAEKALGYFKMRYFRLANATLQSSAQLRIALDMLRRVQLLIN